MATSAFALPGFIALTFSEKLAKRGLLDIIRAPAFLAQLVERLPYTQNVGGSSPSGRTKFSSTVIHGSPKNPANAGFFIAQLSNTV